MNEHDPTHLTKLGRLAALVRDDGVEPESMSPEELVKYLQDRKVDISGPKKRFELTLKKAKAQRSLERAAKLRALGIEKAKTLVSGVAGVGQGTKERVQAMIERLGQRDPEQAHVYARQFEKATEEDLATLEEDLALLDSPDTQDDKGDSQDSR